MNTKGLRDKNNKPFNQKTAIQNQKKQAQRHNHSIFSLDESEHKFIKLRKKLRQITYNPSLNKQNKSNNTGQFQSFPDNVSFDNLDSKVKSKQIKPSCNNFQETQRKKRNFNYPSQQSNENEREQRILLVQKEETLSQINKLLQLKQQYLNNIQKQLIKQPKQVSKKDITHLQQTQKRTAEKVKAPNLYQIREQKRKQKEKSFVY